MSLDQTAHYRVSLADARREAGAGTPAHPQAGRENARERRGPSRPARDGIGRGAGILQTVASLIWLPQAALIAFAIGGIAQGAPAREALGPAFAVLALGLLRAALDALASRIAFREARAVLSAKRAKAVAALAARSPLDRDRAASGAAASAVAEQAEAILPYLARYRAARLRASVVPIVIASCVLPVSWVAALTLLLAAPLIPLFMALIGWRAKAASEEQLVELGSMNGHLLDRLRGLATIRSLGAVELTARRLRADAESLRRRTMAVLRIAFLSSAVLELFAALGVALVAVYIGFHLLGELNFGAWGDKLTLAEGLFVLLLAPAFFEPLRDLSAVWHDRAAGEAALKGLDALAEGGLALLGPNDASGNAAPSSRAAPSVTLQNLRFRYDSGSAPVLDGFHLSVARGEHIALLGPSGSGKSTLLALIAGLAPVEAGRILIDGQVLDAGSAASRRRRMGWIGQRPHLFAGRLVGNVALNRPDLGLARIATALDLARLDDVAAHRGNAPIGEGGSGLSGGEALRLALARACADPDVGLILADEPTAHLDTRTAAEITEGLLSLAEGRTLIVATHDPALAAQMDRVVRLGAPGPEDRT